MERATQGATTPREASILTSFETLCIMSEILEEKEREKMAVDLKQIADNLIKGKAPEVKELVQKALDEGEDVEKVLNEGLVAHRLPRVMLMRLEQMVMLLMRPRLWIRQRNF